MRIRYAFRLNAGICVFFARFEFLPKIQPIFEMSSQLFGQISITGCSTFIYTCCRWHESEFSLEIMAGIAAVVVVVRNMRDRYMCACVLLVDFSLREKGE